MFRLLCCACAVFVFVQCARKPDSSKPLSQKSPNDASGEAVIVKKQAAKSIKNMFEDVNAPVSERLQSVQNGNVIVASKSLVKTDRMMTIYALNENKPFWIYPNRVEDALQVLRESAGDGLDPEDYQYTFISSYYSRLKTKDAVSTQEAFDVEVLLTYNLLKYSRHMMEGKVNPVAVFPEWNYPKRSEYSITDTMYVGILNANPNALVKQIRPDHPIYKHLQETLVQIDTLKKTNLDWQTIHYSGKTLTVGDTASVLLEVKKHLRAIGIYKVDSIDNMFDKPLQEAIKDFQKHTGKAVTGEIDKKTLNSLNFSIPQLRNTVLANMERSRWILHDLPEEYIWINIADFTLTHVKNTKEVYKESVIVGQEVHQTPVFEAKMKYVEFNPYWTLPTSIATKEILPKLKTEPGYLAKHNMQLFVNDLPVEAPASFASYSETNFPYTIKQDPGDKNSLGKVKFMFPNPYSIYLHDTPARNLFEKEERAFSHGCIRLHNPIDFAYHILSPQGYTAKQIAEIVTEGKNHVISMEQKLPVMIVYFTCYSKPGDKGMFFFKDIYGNDQKIVQLLK